MSTATTTQAARERLQAGQLDEAVAEALKAVKQHPADPTPRFLLAELLCIAGDLDRADAQLDALGHQQAEAVPTIAMFRHLIRAEQARRQFFAEGRVPEVVDAPTEEMKLRIEASLRIREGDPAGAAAALERAESLRRRVVGECDGRAIDDFRDLDDLTASVLEVLTANGKYYWVPFERVDSLEMTRPARPRDLIWRAAHLQVRDGPDAEVYVPALYPGSHAAAQPALRLGRATEWSGGPDDGGGPVRGLGLRMYLAGDEAVTALQVEKLTLKPAS